MLQVLTDANFQVATSRLQERGDNGKDVTMLKSVLMLANVRSKDSGVYQCVASNAVATVYSRRAAVTVSGR